MLIDFISTIAAAFAAAGLALIVRHLTGWRLPKWIVPVCAGAAMIGYTIWNEYSWYGRVAEQLPPEVAIVSSPQETSFYRPWSYLSPLTLRFAALDRTGLLRSENAPSLRIATAVFVERWAPTQRVPMAFDCDGNRRAVLIEGAGFGADGGLQNVEWYEAGPEDALVRAACAEV